MVDDTLPHKKLSFLPQKAILFTSKSYPFCPAELCNDMHRPYFHSWRNHSFHPIPTDYKPLTPKVEEWNNKSKKLPKYLYVTIIMCNFASKISERTTLMKQITTSNFTFESLRQKGTPTYSWHGNNSSPIYNIGVAYPPPSI